jgi:hypothetical protein
MFERPAFYAYAYPELPGFASAPAGPDQARYDPTLREFLLPYDDLRRHADPEAAVELFLQSTYAAAADYGHWDRVSLERPA